MAGYHISYAYGIFLHQKQSHIKQSQEKEDYNLTL